MNSHWSLVIYAWAVCLVVGLMWPIGESVATQSSVNPGQALPVDPQQVGVTQLIIDDPNYGSILVEKTHVEAHPDSDDCHYTWVGQPRLILEDWLGNPHDVVLTVCSNDAVYGKYRVLSQTIEVIPGMISAQDVLGGAPPIHPVRIVDSHVHEMDLILVYTQEALEEFGGSEEDFRRTIRFAVAEVNSIFMVQDIPARLRVAHLGNMGAGIEADFESMTDAMKKLNAFSWEPWSDGDDPYGLKALRNTLGADLLSVLTSSNLPGARGVARDPQALAHDDKSFLSVLHAATMHWPAYVLAHELAHNFDAHHELGERNDALLDNIADGAYGYVDAANKFRTIMAYGSACPLICPIGFGGLCEPECTRLPFFSDLVTTIDPASRIWDPDGVRIGTVHEF